MQLSDTLVQSLSVRKKTQHTALERLGLQTVGDLLYHFPSRYTNGPVLFDGTLEKNAHVAITGTITKIGMRRTGGRKRVMMTEATIQTGQKSIRALWFHQPYIARQFSAGSLVEIAGKVSGEEKPYITNPIIKHAEAIPGGLHNGDEVPIDKFTTIYPETLNISSLWLSSAIENVLADEEIQGMEDPIPQEIRDRLSLPHIYDAFIYLHKPRSENEHCAARKRFVFEKIFAMQVAQQQKRHIQSTSRAYNLDIAIDTTIDFMKERFEFKPTGAQNKAVKEILEDIQSATPMTRLLEGDVGSGKTAVAAAVLHAIVSGTILEEKTSGTAQAVYVAPTEILARQQFFTLVSLFKHLPIKIGFLSSKQCLKYPSKLDPTDSTQVSKAQLKKWIVSGELSIVVGTHAVLQKDVAFKRLALIIVDEQHRFGVAQRHALVASSGVHVPHFLSMTATPIPRTLALAIYGDLAISVIDEMPKGRKSVKTKLVTSKKIQDVYTHISKQIAEGRQAYILCPRIEESPDSPLRSVEKEYDHVAEHVFPDLSVGVLHGKMKPKEKQDMSEQFSSGSIQVLVCTTVVEVGINVPNATIIAILHAERFGLAQLHQLRGRVIRSEFQSYCYAVTDSTNEETTKRLKVFTEIYDGFALAEQDLLLRGGGELVGLRQSGISDIAMEGLQNPTLVSLAQKEATALVNEDPDLNKSLVLKQYIQSLSLGE